MSSRLHTTLRLSPPEVQAVHRLVDEVTAADGHLPLSEHVMLHLPLGGDEDVRHVLVEDGGLAGHDTTASSLAGHDTTASSLVGYDTTASSLVGYDTTASSLAGPDTTASSLAGYAHLDVTDPVAGSSAELVVRPSARRSGIGRAMVEELVRQSPDGRLRLWAHGEHPGAGRLAAGLGFTRSRVLWQMRRPLTGELPPYVLPDGVTLRAFRVGADEQEWTALNARAFADHPDQGRWGIEEVLLREQEPWFDPDGFLLAEQDGRLVGFHWTKVHGSDPGSGDHAHEPVGEVYVVGVDPAEQGRGLGPALTLAGLHSLRARGLDSVLLYVDESNAGAVRVYERLGFARSTTDVCWSR